MFERTLYERMLSTAAIFDVIWEPTTRPSKSVGIIKGTQLGRGEAREGRTIRKSLVGGKQAAVVWTEDSGSAAGLK